jgi:tRNA dimethylallyltransferase
VIDERMKSRVVVIVGPTASGKTDMAMRLAEEFSGEIVNADSMLVYRGMDIGTAKPSPEQRQLIPHHLVDIVTPDMNFTVADFRREADWVIADILRRGKCLFVVGGTGLYIKALLQGLAESPGGDEAYRKELQALSLEKGNAELLRQLALVDPDTAQRLHPNDQVRIIRALEVYRQSGRPLSSFRDAHGFAGTSYTSLKIGLRVERDELYQRIDQRVDRMIDAGLVDEVQALLAAGYSPGLKSMRSIGYKEICAFLAGDYDLEEAVRLIKRDSRRYAKRQLTWFAREKEINWLEYPDNFATICKYVIEFLA